MYITFLDKICDGLWHRCAGEGLLPELHRRRVSGRVAAHHGGGASSQHDQQERGWIHASMLHALLKRELEEKEVAYALTG